VTPEQIARCTGETGRFIFNDSLDPCLSRSSSCRSGRARGRCGIRRLPPAELGPEALVAAVEATGASSVFVHVDLDVLDPGELRGIGCPEPQGVSAATVVDAIAAVRARFPLAGAGITEFTPWSVAEAADDLATIRRILGALTG
jgi:arginase